MYPDVPVRTELARGMPDECLVRMAERMNIVVVGSHHGGAASELVFGSVAARETPTSTAASAGPSSPTI